MKKKIFLFLLSGVFLLSCEDIEKTSSQEQIYNEDSSLSLILKSSEYFDWEGSHTIVLGNGKEVTLPWYSGAVTNIPYYILQDFKNEDGWELLYNFCTQTIDLGKNYLVFYNVFTGVVRTYYYLDDQVTSGNEGMWSIDLTNTNSLLNNTDYFALPINQSRSNPVSVSTNISVDVTSKAIARGWNCFDTEITYDPSVSGKSVKMSIRPYDNNISEITLSGSYSSISEGTIVTSGSKNPAQSIVNKGAKEAGDAAGSWIKANVGTKDDASKIIKLGVSALASIASGGTTEIVKYGVNLVFGSFIGRFNKPTTTTQKIEFKTNGTINMTGSLTSTSATNAFSVANLYFPNTTVTNDDFFPHYNKTLGVWNIDQTPVVKVSKKAYLKGESGGYYTYSRDVMLDRSSFNVKINPEVLALVDKYEVSSSLMYYQKFQGKSNWTGTYNSKPDMTYGRLVYDDDLSTFYVPSYELYTLAAMPDYPVGYPDVPYDQLQDWPYIWYSIIDHRYVVKVTVKLYPKAPYSTEPIVVSRTYKPSFVLYNTEPTATSSSMGY